MKFRYRFIYFISTIIIYSLLSLLEFFYLGPLVDLLSKKYLVHVVAMVLCLLIVNPSITYLLISLLPIKPNLRLKGNINEDLRREVK